MENFEDARSAAEDMFTQASLEDAAEESEITAEGDEGGEAPPETNTEEVSDTQPAPPVEQNEPQVQSMSEIEELSEQLSQLQQQNNAVMEQNAQLQNMVNELSRQNAEDIIEDAVEMPILDIGGLAFADEDTLRRAQTDYAQKMADYAKNSIVKELQPLIDEAKRGKAEKERRDVISSLKAVPELSDIEEMLPMMDSVISRNRLLSSDSIPLDERMIAAYAMAKGINSMNEPKPKDPTVDELMDIYNNNPDFQAAVERQRLAAVKDSQQVPPLSASSGAVNAALNIKDTPKSLEEASELARKMFR